MATYHRKDETDKWHWRKNCPDWPKGKHEKFKTNSRPVNLCDKCRSMEMTESQVALRKEEILKVDSNCRFFIIYEKPSGKSYADNLKETLQYQYPQFSAFIYDISPSAQINQEYLINSAIEACKYFIVLITASDMDNKEILRLYEKALGAKKGIIPYKKAELESMLTSGMMTFHKFHFNDSLDLTEKIKSEIDRIEQDESKGVSAATGTDELIRKGVLLYFLGTYERSLELFRRAGELNPEFVHAWLNQGVVLMTLKHYEEAVQIFDKSAQLAPGLFQVWGYKGGAFYMMNKLDEALEAYNKAIELNDNDYMSWLARGLILAQKGRYDEAIKAYNKTIEIRPKQKEALANIGELLDNLARLSESLKFDQRGINSNSSEAMELLNKGVALAKIGNLDEALNLFDKVIELAPDSVHAWYNKGKILNVLGKSDQAMAVFSKADELNKKHPGKKPGAVSEI